MIELISETLTGTRPIAVTTPLVCELHGIAMDGLIERPGTLRQTDVVISGSRHAPPSWQDVPSLLDALGAYHRRSTRDAIHAAAYVLWRINWIHPFAPDGNGRTARAVATFVLFAHLQIEPVSRAEGHTFLELLGWRRLSCYDALAAADAAFARGEVDVSRLEQLLVEVFEQSLSD